MNFRLLVKRDRTKKIIIVEHPETGELVPWVDLGYVNKKMVIRQYFRQCFDEAFNDVMFSLQDPDTNKVEGEIRDTTSEIARIFLEALAGLDRTKTRNTDRGGYRELRDASAITKL